MGKKTRDGEPDFPDIRPTPNHLQESDPASDDAGSPDEGRDEGAPAEGAEES